MMKPDAWFKIILAVIASLFMTFHLAHAQPAPSETAGGLLKQKLETERFQEFKERLDVQERQTTEQVIEEIEADPTAPSVMVRQIVVEGATLVSSMELDDIVRTHEGTRLSMPQMQRVADDITALYRQKGYVTSRAYIPPQSLSNGRLIIKIIEGKLGELEIRGNEHFKSRLLRDYIDLQPRGTFDYSALQRALVYINEHPDRMARIILVPGKTPGTTDLVLEVEDRLPIHVGFEYDNFASRYLKEDRFALTLEHNNLLGFDDRLFLKGQLSQETLLQLYQLRYVFPVDKTWDVGFYLLDVDTELGKEFEVLKAEGDAFLAGIFVTKELIYREDFELRLNAGFDYKDIKNYLLGVKTSEDNLRVFKLGLDLDVSDLWGRNIFTTEFDIGFDDFLGSSDAKDPMASRLGAGGKFNKWMFNFFRLQPMPYESYILWKNSAQFSNYNLVASEQFQIGGPTSVRAYAPAEYSGDRGIYSSIEWSFPLYFLPDDWKIPYREETWYETLKWVFFYDIGFVEVKNPLPGEETTETLKGYGTGIRMNVKDDIEVRVEAAWPIGERSEDGNRTHIWLEFRIKF